ncbi:Golgi SNAP receptor complex member 1-2-like isoform X2 [Primulina huaijiensis]|uniref:Golgi SNAP receptor complex member 1-2-like isoform X2 n=1 Tax=Primulina huaijiensis TaxID=1492673 RepID=UPI003CC72B9D
MGGTPERGKTLLVCEARRSLHPGRSWKSTEMEIQSLLEKLLDKNDSMIRCAASAAPTTSVTQSLPGIGTYCMTQEFRRIQGSIISSSKQAELLNYVRDDISEYKIDDVISQAQATRTALGSERTLFGDVQGNVKLLGDKFSAIRGLLGSIRRKRSRDAFILSAVIAACTLFLIIYWLSK